MQKRKNEILKMCGYEGKPSLIVTQSMADIEKAYGKGNFAKPSENHIAGLNSPMTDTKGIQAIYGTKKASDKPEN